MNYAMTTVDARHTRTRIDHALAHFLETATADLVNIGPDLLPLASTLRTFTTGGKRLRAQFCYWGWRAAGGADNDGIIHAAASLELLQACALIHDDVMDASDTRRGAPAVHRQFEELHRGAQWRGSGARFGEGAAILLGDLALSWADQMLLTSPLPTDALLHGKRVFDLMRTELMAGQYLDLVEQARFAATTESAMRVVRYKSAKYSVEAPLLLGATLAKASEETLAGLSAYGLPLGEAFQLRDDVLGVFGDPLTTGKPAGDDIREGKQTLLIAKAKELGSSSDRAVLNDLLGQAHLSASDIARVQDLIIDTGALAEIEATIARLTTEAELALAPLQQQAPVAAGVLAELIAAATNRKV